MLCTVKVLRFHIVPRVDNWVQIACYQLDLGSEDLSSSVARLHLIEKIYDQALFDNDMQMRPASGDVVTIGEQAWRRTCHRPHGPMHRVCIEWEPCTVRHDQVWHDLGRIADDAIEFNME